MSTIIWSPWWESNPTKAGLEDPRPYTNGRGIFNRIRFGLFYRKIFASCGKDPKTGDTGEIRTHGFSALQALALDHSATDPLNWSRWEVTLPRSNGSKPLFSTCYLT